MVDTWRGGGGVDKRATEACYERDAESILEAYGQSGMVD